MPFGKLVSFQPHLCEAGKAPKQFSTPEYAAVANYAYHLDAGKLGVFMRKHCVEKLGVRHVSDHMTGVNAHDNGDIASLQTRDHGAIEGDLFVDCTGMRALLIGQHYGVELRVAEGRAVQRPRASPLQVPYADPDMADRLPDHFHRAEQRLDLGHRPADAGAASAMSIPARTPPTKRPQTELRRYVRGHRRSRAGRVHAAEDHHPPRLSGAALWHRNCVAIGLSSGFMEPLEASSLVMVELAAGMLSDQMPATRGAMDIVARRYNDAFTYRWERVVDFLKLHYVLTQAHGHRLLARQLPARNHPRPPAATCWNSGATSRPRATTCTAWRKCFPRPATSTSCMAWASSPMRARRHAAHG